MNVRTLHPFTSIPDSNSEVRRLWLPDALLTSQQGAVDTTSLAHAGHVPGLPFRRNFPAPALPQMKAQTNAVVQYRCSTCSMTDKNMGKHIIKHLLMN